MEQGGMHKHTGFYVVEIALAVVLVLVVILFYLWNANLNDQIAVLEGERGELEGQLEATETALEEAEQVEFESPYIISEDEKNVRLFPYAYQLSINGREGLSFPVEFPVGSKVVARKTTDDGIAALHWALSGLAAAEGEAKDVFFQLSTEAPIQSVSLHQGGPLPLDSVSTVTFAEGEYSLRPRLSWTDSCVEDWATEGCTAPVITDALLMNGAPVIDLEPRESTYVQYPEGYGIRPEVRVFLLGISPNFQYAYFSFLGDTYSINASGLIAPAEIPEDLVTVTDEVYE